MPVPCRWYRGQFGRERVHYELPKAERLDRKCRSFLNWFEAKDNVRSCREGGSGAPLCSSPSILSRMGNGRIARAIADMALCPLGTFRAALLQHVGADPCRAQRLLRDARGGSGRATWT